MLYLQGEFFELLFALKYRSCLRLDARLNAGPFLQEAVQSVLAQKECLELLVADGGSTDGSLQVLEELAAVDPRLRIVSRSDRGPAEAINLALRAARGTLIAWLNADDISPSGAFARAGAALAAHPEWLMVYGEGSSSTAIQVWTKAIQHFRHRLVFRVFAPTVSFASLRSCPADRCRCCLENLIRIYARP